MAGKRTLPHIDIDPSTWRKTESYKPPKRKITVPKPSAPAIGRPAHGVALRSSLRKAVDEATERRAGASAVRGASPGVYLEFESFPGWELAIPSLEDKKPKDPRKHIEVVAATERPPKREGEEDVPQRAVVFVPEGQVGKFLEKLEAYARTAPKRKREARHENLYDRVRSLRIATVRALWTDDDAAFPAKEDDPIWWEVWLRRTDGCEVERLARFAEQEGLRLGGRTLQFDHRLVTLAYGSARQLSASLDVLGDIAELQLAKETPTFFVELGAKDQAEWVRDLQSRTELAGEDAPAVCILDTGVNAGHPLLEGSLALEDSHAVDPRWGVHDHQGHGTKMAGLALYGDLTPKLGSSGPVSLSHRLESVKVLPPTGQNAPEVYGAITAEATSRPEIGQPERRRVFSMAVTSRDSRDRGRPTSWSSALDVLAAGRSFDTDESGLVCVDDDEVPHRRLFVLSAGNVEHIEPHGYLDRFDTEPVHDPAQAWNALTVGAYTDKVMIGDPSLEGWSPVAGRGDLSPWSTTSVSFAKDWPIKPEVVMEGGNAVEDGSGEACPCDDLSLLTTHYRPSEKTLVPVWATSAATAQAARLCAIVSVHYPHLWPEAIRALAVHSAKWTPAMNARLQAASGKRARANLVCRYGFGVPDLDRALRSASNAVTLLVQDVIRPFEDGKMREIHLHDLPWPTEVLSSLGHAVVRVRVTLSYFIEPNPGRRGWQKRHRYQSHGLRFDVKRPTEPRDDFRKRINQSALEEEEERPSAEAGDAWFLGPQARNRGSLHSDILHGSAAEIAQRGVIAVYPVTGWWKEQKRRDRSDEGARYALIVSIETDAVGADIYTPIATQVGIPVTITV